MSNWLKGNPYANSELKILQVHGSLPLIYTGNKSLQPLQAKTVS
jgi:hypothetical protein